VRAVAFSNAGEAGVDELTGRESSSSECCDRILHAEVGRIGHDAIISRPTNERSALGCGQRPGLHSHGLMCESCHLFGSGTIVLYTNTF
jgi:hypothetical protein